MARTYAQLRNLVDVSLQRASGTLTTADFDASMNFALDSLRDLIDFPETYKTAQLTPALFEDVFTYVAPTDLYGDNILGIRPFTELPTSQWNNSWDKNTSTEFDLNEIGDRAKNKWAIEYNNGVKTLKLNARIYPRASSVVLNNCDTIDNNGTWTADTVNSDATNVLSNLATFFEGTGSVQFDIDVSQTANNYARLYVALNEVSDISDLNDPYLFFYTYLSSVKYVSSITLVIGSDASCTPATKANYYTKSITTVFGGGAFADGKNICGDRLSGFTSVGTPDKTSIKYIEFTVNYSAAQADMTACLIDNFVARDGIGYDVRYITNNIISDVSGTKKQYFTADDDYLLLNSEGEQVFIEYATAHIAPKVRSLQEAGTFMQMAQKAVDKYNSRYPSERRRTKRNYYYGANID